MLAMVASGGSQPDIVVIVTDQQRADQFGFSSEGHFETPAVDALARGGVVFDCAYSASTVCVPARVSMLTGRQPHRVPTQENWFALREGAWTVARGLAANGYQTAAIGKMHFAPVHADHGFETLRLCEHLGTQGLGPMSRASGDVVDEFHHWLNARGIDDWRLASGAPVDGPFRYAAEAHPTAWIERETSAFLGDRDTSRPMFLVVSFPNPHEPYDPPEPYASMYDPRDSVLPPTGPEVNVGLPMAMSLAITQSTTRVEAADVSYIRWFLALRRGLVRQIDDAIGRILRALDLDNTLVIVTSDHGDFSGHRGLTRKNPSIPFDDLARVALVVAAPGMAPGRRIADVVQTSDIALTCLDYAGVPTPGSETFDSETLRPHVEGKSVPSSRNRAVYSAISMGWPMIRVGRHKLIAHHEKPGKALFDLESDPYETTNLFLDPDYATVRGHLVERLDHMASSARVAFGRFDATSEGTE
jgi:choline-sulfatase